MSETYRLFVRFLRQEVFRFQVTVGGSWKDLATDLSICGGEKPLAFLRYVIVKLTRLPLL